MLRFCLFVLMLSFLSSVAFAKLKLLVIESYHSELVWDSLYLEELKSVLGDSVEWTFFEMDTKRLQESEYEGQADKAWACYQREKPDIVVLGDDNALHYLGSRFVGTDVPVVYLGINQNPRDYIPLQKNVTGVLERPLFKRAIVLLEDIIGNSEGKVLLLIDSGRTARSIVENVFDGKDSVTEFGVHVDVISTSSFDKWRNAVLFAKFNGYKYIITGLYHRVFDGERHVDSESLLRWTSSHAPVPLFGFWEMGVGKGLSAGGLVLDGKIQGSEAAKVVQDILNGKDPATIIPIIPDRGKLIFSRHELERWGLNIPDKFKARTTFIE